MILPVIAPVEAIGIHRPLCVHSVRVAADLATTSSQIGAAQRRRQGIPIDQCGKRSDFMIDGKPICRAHAGHIALNALLNLHAPAQARQTKEN